MILLDSICRVAPDDDPRALLVDGGVENFNAAIDELIGSGKLRRLLALTDISFSNSLIESWWRSLKHKRLHLNSLDSVQTIRRLVKFYIEEHSTRLPHSAFRGQTPDEMYFSTGGGVSEELVAARKEARRKRMEENRRETCSPVSERRRQSHFVSDEDEK